jgi:heterodisulfide reductase subunit A
MPANSEEIDETIEEGVDIQYLSAPIEIIGENGKIKTVKCIRMKLGEPDSSGRRRPIPIEGSEYTIECDMLIPAISQEPDFKDFGDEINDFKLTRWATMLLDH